MDWNSLFEQWGATWGSWGAVFLLTIKMSILDPLMTRKTQFNLSSFQTLQTSVKDEVKAYTKLLVDGFDEFKKTTVEPLLNELKQKDYQQAIANDIIITLMSNVNVPLVNKETAFKGLSNLQGMNQELVNKILADIEKQKSVAVVEQKVSQEAYTELKGV